MEITSLLNKTGAKFYRYKEGQDEPEVIRIYKVDEVKKIIKIIDNKNEKRQVNFDRLINEYRQLSPDGIINISIVKNNTVSDVIVSLGRFVHNERDGNLPYAVCRQLIYDVFGNYASMSRKVYDFGNKVYSGMSISQETCPNNVKFQDVLLCDKLIENRSILVYRDDTLDDILGLISTKKYDSILRNIKELSKSTDLGTFNIGDIPVGFCNSFRELLESNNFMYDFRQAFHIIEVPHHIEETDDKLGIENILYIENEIKANILNTYMIKYTREIDLSEIKRDYMLVSSASDGFKNLYIVAFDKASGDYIPRSMA